MVNINFCFWVFFVSHLTSTVTGDYFYSSVGLESVDVYIIDTGVYAEHPEFEGRVTKSVDYTGEGLGDMNGHGTHVAGIVGSRTYGAAKNVNMIDVKVLTGLGTGNLSAVIAGLEFAVNHRKTYNEKAVANLSLGAGFNSLLNAAVNAAVESGLPVIVAAGNSNSAACASSPASASGALTVGAIDDRYDTIASFSNWGSCVALFASGVYVTSLSNLGHGTLALSGTSMAAPVVSATIAMFIGKGSTVEEAVAKISQLATHDKIDRRSIFFRPRTPNKILYNGEGMDIGMEDHQGEDQDGSSDMYFESDMGVVSDSSKSEDYSSSNWWKRPRKLRVLDRLH